MESLPKLRRMSYAILIVRDRGTSVKVMVTRSGGDDTDVDR
eukprot:CAMPEP_0197443596 /NCGR_PEP_ID=MMETSP1175-20131217/9298_1 /TAXON_ID=1003142 /ORGANISM="Triceratium dubium, Strain CCMP147" /LENGTH=40 /DNA_ID= /DNA_START= /DNA_END= /DNA_ORIENTATION=